VQAEKPLATVDFVVRGFFQIAFSSSAAILTIFKNKNA